MHEATIWTRDRIAEAVRIVAHHQPPSVKAAAALLSCSTDDAEWLLTEYADAIEAAAARIELTGAGIVRQSKRIVARGLSIIEDALAGGDIDPTEVTDLLKIPARLIEAEERSRTAASKKDKLPALDIRVINDGDNFGISIRPLEQSEIIDAETRAVQDAGREDSL